VRRFGVIVLAISAVSLQQAQGVVAERILIADQVIG
jgi:hypothetical protein